MPCADEIAVEIEAVLRDAALCRVVNVHQTKSLAVPVAPFKVVEERPHKVAVHAVAFLHGPLHLANVSGEVADAVFIVHPSVMCDDIHAGIAVFRDVQSFHWVVIPDVFDGPVHGVWQDWPPQRVAWCAERRHDLAVADRGVVGRNVKSGVAIEAKEIERCRDVAHVVVENLWFLARFPGIVWVAPLVEWIKE